MIICDICLHELPDDTEKCPFCSNDLVGPADDQPIEWVIVRTVSTEIEARLISGRLEANGIPACVLSQVDTTRGFTVGALAIAKVFVPRQLFDEADALLETRADDPETDDPETDEALAEGN